MSVRLQNINALNVPVGSFFPLGYRLKVMRSLHPTVLIVCSRMKVLVLLFSAAEMSPDYKSLIATNRKLIARSIVVSDYLLDELSSVKCLENIIPDIEKLPSLDRVEKLLSALKRVPAEESESVFIAFIRALREDGQEHVANIFFPQSEVGPLPMSDEHHRQLVRNTEQVCKFLDPLNGVLE